MPSFTPKKFDLSTINSGQKYERGDGITPEAINAPIEAAALLQSLATNPPDYSQAGNVGTPIVEIGGTEGSPKFVFKNIKGEKGEQGERGEKGAQGEQGIQGVQGVQGEKGQDGKDGVDGKDGHTTPAPNFLINGNFAINQREDYFPEYYNNQTVPYYVVDKWLLYEGSVLWAQPNNVRLAGDANGKLSFRQYIAMPNGSEPVSDWCLSMNHICASENFRINFYRYYPSSGEHEYYFGTYLPRKEQDYGDWHFSQVFPLSRTYNYDFLCFEIYGENLTADDTLTLKWVKIERGIVDTGYSARPFLEELALCQATFFPIASNTIFPAITSFRWANFTIPLNTCSLYSFGEPSGVTLYAPDGWAVITSNATVDVDSEQVDLNIHEHFASSFLNVSITDDTLNDFIDTTCASVVSNGNAFIDMDIYG